MMSAPQLDTTIRIALEMAYGVLVPVVALARGLDEPLYCQLRSSVVEMARVLGKEAPIVTRAKRREQGNATPR